MKRLLGYLSALVLSGALLTGCGDDGTDYDALALAFEDCSQESMASLINVLYALVSVPDAIENEEDEPFPGFHVTSLNQLPSPPAAPNSWSFSVIFDTNGNGIPDTTVSGTAVFSDNPADGIGPGETIQITFQVDNSVVSGAVDTGTLTGSGNILVTLGLVTEDAAITGTASFTDGTCSADLTFDESDPLNISFDSTVEVQLAADLEVLEIFGLIQAFLETRGHDFAGDLAIEQEGNTVFVTGLIDDTVEVDTDFELVPPQEVLNALLGCAFTTFDWLEFFAQVYEDVGTVADGGTVTGISVTPVSSNAFNYTINLAQYDPLTFTAGTITGRATLIFPALTGVPPSEVTVTWTLTNATFPSGDVTSGRNTSGRPLRFYLELDQIVAFSGAGELSTIVATPPLVGITPTMDCDVTFDIPDNDPIDVIIEGENGTVILTTTVDGNVMTFFVDFENEDVLVTINGIPFPFFF